LIGFCSLDRFERNLKFWLASGTGKRANIYRFAEHMKNDKCEQCIAWFRQTDKELKTIKLLAAWRKSRNN